jgi:hypothetical protein
MLFQTLKDLKIDPVEDTRLERIEQIAYLIVTGDVFNTKQGAGIIVPRGVLEMLLMRKKRRQWHIKDAESAQGSVFDPVTLFISHLHYAAIFWMDSSWKGICRSLKLCS